MYNGGMSRVLLIKSWMDVDFESFWLPRMFYHIISLGKTVFSSIIGWKIANLRNLSNNLLIKNEH